MENMLVGISAVPGSDAFELNAENTGLINRLGPEGAAKSVPSSPQSRATGNVIPPTVLVIPQLSAFMYLRFEVSKSAAIDDTPENAVVGESIWSPTELICAATVVPVLFQPIILFANPIVSSRKTISTVGSCGLESERLT